MSNPSIDLNLQVTEPTLADLLNLHKKDIFLSMNCHAIATIQSFDSEKQTVTATINYKRTYSRRGADGIYSDVLVDYPILLDVPVVVMQGGPASLTFPIQSGDTCLILFNDRDIDNWFQSGQIGAVASSRLHSFSDGIALIGLRPASNPISDYDETRAGLAWGETMVKVSASKVKIGNEDTTLNTLLQDLIDQIKLLTVTCAAPGNASSVPVNAAAFAAIATQIEGLLE